MKKIQNYCALAVLMWLTACASEQQPAQETNVSAITVEEVTVKAEKKAIYIAKNKVLAQGDRKLDIAYPQFSGVGDGTASPILNDVVKVMLDSTLAAHKRSGGTHPADNNAVNDTIKVADADVETVKQGAGLQRTLSVTYQILQQSQEYIEIAFSFYEDLGGAHPTAYRKNINFDVANKKIVGVKNLFMPNSNYLQELSNACRADLMARKDQIQTDSAMIFSGTEPKEENFMLFGLQNDTLSIFFDPVEVAPSVSGEQTVKLPLSKLANILDPQSVATKLKK